MNGSMFQTGCMTGCGKRVCLYGMMVRYMYGGRTSTGQSMLFDDVISEICNDMEILEGQKNRMEDLN